MMKPSVTLADVAQAANVSLQTVSRALNNKGEINPQTRSRILHIAEQLGYRRNGIAHSLATNRTMTLGLILPDIANPFFPEIARGAEEVALSHGYNIFLCNTVEDPAREETVLRLLEEKRVDGVILCSSRLTDERLIPLLQRQRAAVLVNRPVAPEVAASVRIDDAHGIALAVAHLLAGDRQPIAFLAGPAHAHSSHIRTQAFTDALAAGIPCNPQLVCPCSPDVGGGYRAARALLNAETPVQGIICYNDLVAIGALQACAEQGVRVPDAVAVIGCDDILLAGLATPALTTLHVPKSNIGATALRLLLARIEGETHHIETVFTPTLVIRASAP